MGIRYTVKKCKSDWGWFSLDEDFVHQHVEVPGDCYRWNDSVGKSFTGCLEKIAKRFNSYTDGAWRIIEDSQDIGIEDADPYESQAHEINKMRIG